MTIPFQTVAHQYFYEKMRGLLIEKYGQVVTNDVEPDLMVMHKNGAQLHVYVTPFGPMDTVVHVTTLIERKGTERDASWLRARLESNTALTFASFRLDEGGNLFLGNTMLGSCVNRVHLAACIAAIAKAAERAGAPQDMPVPEAEPEPAAPSASSDHATLDRIGLDKLEVYYCIRGLPISVSEIVTALESGTSDQQILADHPDLDADDLTSVRAFAERSPDKVHEGIEKPTPAAVLPAPEPAKTEEVPPKAACLTDEPPEPRAIRRIWLDDLEIYYCIRGLPISVSEIVKMLDEGTSDVSVLAQYPDLVQDDLVDVKLFAQRYPDKVHQGSALAKQSKPEPPILISAPNPTVTAVVRKPKRRIFPDSLDLYYCIRRLPISVNDVKDRLDAGASDEEVLAEYPALEAEDLDAVRAFEPDSYVK